MRMHRWAERDEGGSGDSAERSGEMCGMFHGVFKAIQWGWDKKYTTFVSVDHCRTFYLI